METKQVDEMISKYCSGFSTGITTRPGNVERGGELVVFITGTTGRLGSHMLANLLSDQSVTKVYAFNRPSGTRLTGSSTLDGYSSILNRHMKTFVEQGLDPDLLRDNNSKVTYICGDATKDKLGLDELMYEEIRRRVTLIIHNAWRLGFHIPLEAFESNIAGTGKLIDFALSTPYDYCPRFVFISSCTSAQAWSPKDGFCPEEVITDSVVSLGTGYGESKYVAEQILARSGLSQAISIRVCQICGDSKKGIWPTNEWFPILVKTCMKLGAFPTSPSVISWLPVDVVSQSILEVALSPKFGEGSMDPLVLNLVHPRPVLTDWLVKEVTKQIVSASQTDGGGVEPDFEFVASDQFFNRLFEIADMSGGIKDDAYLKLRNFFLLSSKKDSAHNTIDSEGGGLSRFECGKMLSLSPALRGVGRIDSRDVERWVRYWVDVGFLKVHHGLRGRSLERIAKL